MIESIEVKGVLVHECSLPGETRADDVFPGHPNGIPVSRDKWLLVYATRGWRSVDDDRSVVYQLRAGSPDGKLIREGMLSRSINDWDPLGDGRKLVRQHGHPVAFGVPKGALLRGRPAPSANVFVVKWRFHAPGAVDRATGLVQRDAEAAARTHAVGWVQLRLNEAEDGVEVLQPAQTLRQKGYEEGPAFCSAQGVRHMNQSFVQAVPFSADGTEWADCNHFDGGSVAPLKYRFNAHRGAYEWVETGPLMHAEALPVSEASLARVGDSWLIAARSENAIGWVRTDDPFARAPSPVFTTDPAINAPVTLYACADGVPRIFTGNRATSPYGMGRNPLYCWSIDPVAFRASDPRMIFDCIATGTLPEDTIPRAEMCKLLPHTGGRRQWLIWRVRTKNVGHVYGSLPPVRPEWKAKHGLYYAAVTYDKEHPSPWQFAER